MAAAGLAATAAFAEDGSIATQAQQERRSPPTEEKSPEALAREAIEKLMQAIGRALEALPQYEMPTMNERGDIIIRRKNPPPPKPPGQPDDSTRT
jgi:hypothetical protein